MVVVQVPSARLMVCPRGGPLQPDSDFIYMQVEPKQHIDFGCISYDSHLCNKTVPAANISFLFYLMERGLFIWE